MEDAQGTLPRGKKKQVVKRPPTTKKEMGEKTPTASTLLMVDEATLRKVVADTVRQVMNKAKEEAEASKEMATLTREEVTKLLNVTKPTLWRWEKAGYLLPKKVGKRVLYLRSEVEAMIRKGGAA